MSHGNEERRGRPLDHDLSKKIMEETRRQLREGGMSALRVPEIASALGCGVSSIYRRWPTREALMAAALLDRPPIEFVDSGDPVDDLHSAVVASLDSLAVSATLIAATMELALADESVGSALRQVLAPIRGTLIGLVGDIVGEGHPCIEYVVDSIPGSLMFRRGFLGATATSTEIADDVVELVKALAAKPDAGTR